MAELKYNFSELTKKSEGSKSVGERRVARRVSQSLLVQIYEEAFALKQKKNYASIPAKFELAALIKPKRIREFFMNLPAPMPALATRAARQPH